MRCTRIIGVSYADKGLVRSVPGMVFGLAWMVVPAVAQECMNGPALAMTVFDEGPGPALYAGGQFIMAGGAAVATLTVPILRSMVPALGALPFSRRHFS